MADKVVVVIACSAGVILEWNTECWINQFDAAILDRNWMFDR